MANPFSIPPLGSVQIGTLGSTGHTQVAGGVTDAGSFGELLQNYFEQTNQTQLKSEHAIRDLVTGKTDNVQEVILATAQAEMSFQLFMEIRNQLIGAYNELMRMQF